MKRILSFLLALLLLCTLAAAALAAPEADEAMRLSSFSGTVTVKNASGIVLEASEGMALYNGYTVETGLDSTALIRLDDNKEIALDSLSICSVKRSGNTAETFLIAGLLFFKTARPLEGDEAFLIRTHELVNSVHGSSGWERSTELGYLTGSGLARNGTKETLVQGGEMLYLEDASDTQSSDLGTEATGMIKMPIKPAYIPPFVVTKVLEDAELLEKLEDVSPTVFTQGSFDDVEERLAADAAANRKRADEALAATAAQNAAIGTSSSIYLTDSRAEAYRGAAPARPAEPAVEDPSNAEDVSASQNPADSRELMAKLAGGNATLDAGGWTISYSGVTVGAGQELNITGTGTVSMPRLTIAAGGNVTVAAGSTLDLSGTDLVWHGTLANNGTVQSSAEIALAGGDARIVNNGTFVNSELLAIGPGASFTGGTVNNTGTVIVGNSGGFDPGSVNGVVIRDNYNH